jgi:hypothetical protein
MSQIIGVSVHVHEKTDRQTDMMKLMGSFQNAPKMVITTWNFVT